MNFTHVHLFLNHLPFLGMVFTSVFLIYALYKKNLNLVKILLWVTVFFALLTIPVFSTGDPAGETLKSIPGISEEMIENHEEAGWISLILMEATGVFAFISIFIIKKKELVTGWIKYIFMFLAVITIISFARTANLGGEIRHPEITPVQEQR